MYPLTATGFLGQLSLGGGVMIDNYKASLRLDLAQTITSRENQETLQEALNRIGSTLSRQGYLLIR